MQLGLIFLLVAVCSIHQSTCTRTEQQTVEDDGTVRTVITEEWETEERRGHGRGNGGRGRGDTIIIMTNDDDNQGSQVESDVESHHHGIKPKTVPVNRLYNDKLADFDYVTTADEQDRLTRNGYTFDGNIGRIVAKREDFPECADLMPITKAYSSCGCHALAATAATMRYLAGGAWQDTGVIGYGVLDKGKCGATTRVRHIHKNNANCNLILHFQTSIDAEYNSYKNLGYVDSSAADFYLWEENDSFTPQPRPHSIEDKTALLNRLYNDKLADFDYSIDRQQEDILTRASGGYRFDGSLGRIVTKQSDLSDCSALVPLTRMYSACGCHALAASAASIRYLEGGGWQNKGVIGFGVLENGKCGATVQVRHMHLVNANCNLILHFQTKSDAEYDYYKKLGYVDSVAPTFYIWEA
jgi:hypothetical protein